MATTAATGKFAIITGASTGIGFELATLAAKDGYDILVVANEPLIQSAAADFKQFGTSVQAVEADLSTIKGVDQLLAATTGRQVDILCANAGHGLGHAFLDQALADWRSVVDTNITGTLYLVQKVLPAMVARNDGKVLVTGSVAGYIPGAFQAVYNGSKAFIDSFTEALRMWNRTVVRFRSRIAPISSLVLPDAAQRRHSTSRLVSRAFAMAGRRRSVTLT